MEGTPKQLERALLRGIEIMFFSCLDMRKPGDLEGTGRRLGGVPLGG